MDSGIIIKYVIEKLYPSGPYRYISGELINNKYVLIHHKACYGYASYYVLVDIYIKPKILFNPETEGIFYIKGRMNKYKRSLMNERIAYYEKYGN